MTLMKSVLLGSAATLVVVAGAQAADLPTKKGAPAAEYVKVCKVGDIAGFIIPGSDTCLKIGGLCAGDDHEGGRGAEQKALHKSHNFRPPVSRKMGVAKAQGVRRRAKRASIENR